MMDSPEASGEGALRECVEGGAKRSHSALATHPSLLSRVRNPSDHAAWRQFEARYRDLVFRFCRARGVQHADAEDVAQIVMASLSKAMPQFTYDPNRGRFRDYLFRCTRNALSQWLARPRVAVGPLVVDVEAVARESSGPALSDEANQWEAEWVAHHYRRALVEVRATFEERSVEIFDRSVRGETVADLASEFGLSEQAVHKIRQRIKARLRDTIARQVREEDAVNE